MSQTIAFALIDTVQSKAADLQQQAGSLDGTLTIAIDKYQGIALQKRSTVRSAKFARRAEIAAAA
jgi:hypothetical protein